MIPRKKTGKALAASAAVLAALSLALVACSAPSSSGGSAVSTASSSNASSNEIVPVEIDTEGIALGDSYVIEGFTGAKTGSDAVPEPNAKMLAVPSVEVSYPATWEIVETQVNEYQESKYGTMSKVVVLQGPTGLRVSVTLATSMGGGAYGKDTEIEAICPTGIDGVWLAWANTPQYGFSFPQYINRTYIDEQEAGTRNPFPGFANLQEGYLYGSIYLPESGQTSASPDRQNYADNPDLNAACAILESVRLV